MAAKVQSKRKTSFEHPVKVKPTKKSKVPCEQGNKCMIQEDHGHIAHEDEPKVLNTILEHIGNTPLVKVNQISAKAGLKCRLLAKCEFFNAGGSVKDRIGKRMVEDAMASGRIKPGDTLIEPTSGNTGIGLSLAAAIYGFRMIITLPEKMSDEKVNMLKALGAEIIRTPNDAAWDSPDSHIGVAKRLNKEIPNSHILDQYKNPSNPLAHYDGTAEEILKACNGKIDMLVAGAGTGGTITGTAKKLKEKCPECVIVGVDPVGSILAVPESLNDHKRLEYYDVEGIGYDFIPDVLQRDVVDKWIKMDDKRSFLMARRMIREEGLMCGGSCGTAMAAAIEAAKDLREDQTCVVILPDSTRNYMTKFLSDDWLYDRGFVENAERPLKNKSWWSDKLVSDLPLQPPCTITPSVTNKEAVDILRKQGFDTLPVVSDDGDILGVVSEGNLIAQITRDQVSAGDNVDKAMYRQFKTIKPDDSLAQLSQIFDKDHFALAMTDQNQYLPGGERRTKQVIFGVVTRIDLLTFITGSKNE